SSLISDMVAECTFAFDEDTHLIYALRSAKGSVPLRNVHPSKVLTTSTGIASSFSSQEPRRPRFSFFNLHNVKELTLSLKGKTSVRQSPLISFQQNNFH